MPGTVIRPGDIGLAAKILWLTLKMERQKGVVWLTDKWIGFKEAFMTVATEAVYGVAKTLTSAWVGLQTAWVETVAFLSKAWTVFTSSLVTGWRTAQNWIAKKFVRLMAMFDSSVDVEAAQKMLDEDFERERRRRDQATQQQLRNIETTRQAKRQAIDEDNRGTLDALNEDRERRHVERKRQYDADLKAAEDAVAEAKRQWQEALDEAARKRAEIPQTVGPDRVKGIGDLEEFDFEGLARRSISVTGTFNALAAAGLRPDKARLPSRPSAGAELHPGACSSCESPAADTVFAWPWMVSLPCWVQRAIGRWQKTRPDGTSVSAANTC